MIRQLKEMVILPLLYPDLYRQMGITAPRFAPLTRSIPVSGNLIPCEHHLASSGVLAEFLHS